MSYYFECETRNIYDGRDVVETVDMDIFLEFLEDYHEEKWKKQGWSHISQVEWVKLPMGSLEWRRKCVRAYKRYVENAFDACFSNKNYGKSPIYKAYCYFIKANYNQ